MKTYPVTMKDRETGEVFEAVLVGSVYEYHAGRGQEVTILTFESSDGDKFRLTLDEAAAMCEEEARS